MKRKQTNLTDWIEKKKKPLTCLSIFPGVKGETELEAGETATPTGILHEKVEYAGEVVLEEHDKGSAGLVEHGRGSVLVEQPVLWEERGSQLTGILHEMVEY